MRMKHYIIVKYNETGKDKDELFGKAEGLFEPVREIPGVYEVRLYRNCTMRDNRYDLMIVMEMEQSALEVYDSSQAHIDWKEQFGRYIAKKTIFDHLIEEMDGKSD